jgi:hypothetical protein
LTVENGMSLSCKDLAAAWKSEGEDVKHKTSLQTCVADMLANYNVDRDGTDLPESCPYGFFPTVMDEMYPSTERVEFTSTIFATIQDVESGMFDLADTYARGKGKISGAYDTQNEDFVNYALDDQLLIDMSLAVGSAIVTTIAMMIHTRSPFLTCKISDSSLYSLFFSSLTHSHHRLCFRSCRVGANCTKLSRGILLLHLHSRA